MAKRKIIWAKRAVQQLNAAIKYIREDSEQNTDNAQETILNKIAELSEDSIRHRKDPYKKNNDGHYLYFEIIKYRIVYYAEPKKVFIIRIRHTSMEPKRY